LAPLARALLQRRYPDAVLVSALDRESTRPLLARIAAELAERWDESAKVPESVRSLEASARAELDADEATAGDADDEDLAGAVDDEAADATSASTLDDLLAAAGRRPKKPRDATTPRRHAVKGP